MGLDRLYGNRTLKESLSRPDRLPHALLISGAPGSGRHTLALLLTQMLLCDRPEQAPCGVCENCKRVAEGIHPDAPPLSAFTAPKDREKKAITVDTVRALRADAFVRPNQGRRKVYCIDPADAMNPNAQNALLKVLEDGPEYVTFLLLSDNPMALLPTIRSRCVACPLAPVDREEVMAALIARFPDRAWKELAEAADQSRGLIGAAIALVEGDSREDPAALASAEGCIAALCQSSELALMEWSVAVQNEKLSREQFTRVYGLLEERLVDALAQRGRGVALQEALGPVCPAVLELCRQGREAMERNVSPAISAGWFAAAVSELFQRSPLH